MVRCDGAAGKVYGPEEQAAVCRWGGVPGGAWAAGGGRGEVFGGARRECSVEVEWDCAGVWSSVLAWGNGMDDCG